MSAVPGHSVLQRLDSLVDWERAKRAAMCVDLSPQLDLMQRLGQPHLASSVVHVTGTKGKGSVCALVEAGLRAAGWKVGRYGSQHLESLCERVILDGRLIDEDFFDRCLTQALDARDAACTASTHAKAATWFDVVTAAAFVAFKEASVDWTVVEVGLGGRLDATNVVQPRACVITNIGLEHTDILGKTRAQIAEQKSGIIKPGVPVITGVSAHDEAGQVIARQAEKMQAPVTFVPTEHLLGVGQRNLAVARATLSVLGEQGVRHRLHHRPIEGADLTDEHAQGSRLPGRMERMWMRSRVDERAREVQVVLDGAHVDFALKAVIDELRLDPQCRGPLAVVFALGPDKNAQAMLSQLRGQTEWVVCTTLEPGRPCWPCDDLSGMGQRMGLNTISVAGFNAALDHAYDWALTSADPSAWILVTGSLHLVGALRSRLHSSVSKA